MNLEPTRWTEVEFGGTLWTMTDPAYTDATCPSVWNVSQIRRIEAIAQQILGGSGIVIPRQFSLPVPKQRTPTPQHKEQHDATDH